MPALSYDNDSPFSNHPMPGFVKILIPLAIIGIVALIAFNMSVKQISSGEVGVLRSFGVIHDKPMTEGLRFLIAGVETVQIFDTKIKNEQIDAKAATLDMQQVDILINLNQRVPGDRVPALIKNVGEDYMTSLITPMAQEVVKSVSAQYSAQEMVSKREEMRSKAFAELKVRLEKYGVQLEELSFVNLTFSESFLKAIEDKQIAEQNAQKAVRDLERIKVENQQLVEKAKAAAESRIVQAKAEADSNALLAKSVDDKVIQLRQLEKWDGKLPTTYMGDGKSIPVFNTNK